MAFGATVVMGLVLTASSMAALVVVDGDDVVPDGGGCGNSANPCNTIQIGVDTADGNDTVQVRATPFSAGGYEEGVLIPAGKDGLTILGPQAGVPGDERHPNPDPADEAIVDPPDVDVNLNPAANAFRVFSENVTIDGFAIVNRNNDPGDPATVAINGISINSDGMDIANNIVRDQTIGIALRNDNHQIRETALIANNEDGPAAGNAIYADTGVNDIDIDRNTFRDNGNSGALIVGPPTSDAVAITDNEFQGAGLTDNTFVFLDSLTNSVISRNRVIEPDGSAMFIGGSTSLDIRNNVIDGAGFSALRFAGPIDGFGANSDVEVIGNQLTDSGDNGIRVVDGAFADVLQAHINRITGNGVGVENEGALNPEIEAENNFWGCNTGPNTAGCDTTQGPGVVDDDPYLQLGAGSAEDNVTVPGETIIEGSFRQNSQGVEPVDIDEFPATNVNFTKVSGPGTVSSPSDRTTGEGGSDPGVARASISSSTAGIATWQATTDNASATDTVNFVAAPAPPDDGGPPPPPAPACDGRTIEGTPGDDELIGTCGPDRIIGGDGNDRILGGGGNDFIDAGAGNDTANAGNGGDRVFGGSGNDTIRGANGDDRLDGGEDNDRILSGSGDDAVAGNEGDDRVDAGSGDDKIYGQEGGDRLLGDSGRDRIRGGDGRDRLFGDLDDDRLFGGRGWDFLNGGPGDDRLFGGRGWDFLDGGPGDDAVRGGPGRDRMP